MKPRSPALQTDGFNLWATREAPGTSMSDVETEAVFPQLTHGRKGAEWKVHWKCQNSDTFLPFGREGKMRERKPKPDPYVLLHSALLTLEQSYSGKKEKVTLSLKGGWRHPEGRGLLHFWYWTHWQEWPKLSYKELFCHLPRGPMVFGEGVQIKIMSAICTQLSQGAWGLCNICYCWWRFDLQSSVSNPGLWGPGLFFISQ